MQSDPNQGNLAPQYTIPIQQHGRTKWDVIHDNIPYIITGTGIVVTAVSVTAYVLINGIDALVDVMVCNWPVLASPVIGWILGTYVARSLVRPSFRVLVHLDPESHMISVLRVPEAMFRDIDQVGNNVVYHTPNGCPVYLVRDFDPWNGIIDYGWVHTSDPLIVMTRESAYNKWKDTLDQVLEENLTLMHHPHTIGLGYARDCLRRHLDDISDSLGLRNQDFEGHETYPDPTGNRDGESPSKEPQIVSINGQRVHHG